MHVILRKCEPRTRPSPAAAVGKRPATTANALPPRGEPPGKASPRTVAVDRFSAGRSDFDDGDARSRARSSPSVAGSRASEDADPSSPRPARRLSGSMSCSPAPGASPASPRFAASAEIENIRGLEKELHALSTAIRSYPNSSETWLLLRSYLDRAREELDAILRDIEIRPHTIHIMAPSGNLGLVVGKPADGGPVYVRSLHPLSPLKDRVRLSDKIVAIDGEDVRRLSPVEVGKLLCRITAKELRKISIVRDYVLVV